MDDEATYPDDYLAARARSTLAHGTGPRCERCGLPMTLGQRGKHWMCRDVDAVDQAEADYNEGGWGDGAPGDPDAPRLPAPPSARVTGGRPVADVRGGRFLG